MNQPNRRDARYFHNIQRFLHATVIIPRQAVVGESGGTMFTFFYELPMDWTGEDYRGCFNEAYDKAFPDYIKLKPGGERMVIKYVTGLGSTVRCMERDLREIKEYVKSKGKTLYNPLGVGTDDVSTDQGGSSNI